MRITAVPRDSVIIAGTPQSRNSICSAVLRRAALKWSQCGLTDDRGRSKTVV